MSPSTESKEKLLELAKVYASMIDPIPEEPFRETCRRLKAEAGGRIQKQVFFEAVKIIRKRLFTNTPLTKFEE